MNPTTRVFLEHILESSQIIQEYVRGTTKQGFLTSMQAQDAVIRRLEIIGEAVKNLPPEFRAEHPEVPWRQIAGLRDVLIHHYMSVDYDLTWTITQKDIPELERQIKRILDESEG